MCGITGCITKRGDVANILYNSLKRLEYRGYDSAGVSTLFQGKLLVKKDVGKIDEIHSRMNFLDLPGNIGIAHTRWATHGAPSQANAHPHLDCTEKIAVVHNGVLENFIELKQELETRKHAFKSKTDTEVIAHLVEEYLKIGKEFTESVLETVRKLRGSYAIAVLCANEPDKIIVARNESPLVIGLGKEMNLVASDVAALIEYTNRVIFLENGDLAAVTSDDFQIIRIDSGVPVQRRITELDWTLEMAVKGGYPHYMLKEIFDQPNVLREALRIQDKYLDLLTEFLDRGREVFLLASGTSHNACIVGSYMFSKLARLSAFPVIASEFVENYGSSIGIDTVILALSQSGETADVLTSLEYARYRAATIIGVTNVLGSTLTRIARAYVLQNAGPEIGVAATKTFTSQLMVLALLALRLARKRGKISQYEIDEFQEELRHIPRLVERTLELSNEPIRKLSKEVARFSSMFFLGRGLSYATALEARLKIMELSYIPSIAYPAGESKHGPISVIEEGYPVFFITPNDETRKHIIGNIMEMKARGAKIYCVGAEGDEEIKQLSNWHLGLPPTHALLSPILYIIPFQLLAYYTAIEKGYDPDKPRNLAKSVTVL